MKEVPTKMREHNGLLVLISLLIAGCNPPFIEDSLDGNTTQGNKVTTAASFYINVNPYCCERRGLDSAEVVNAALESYGSVVEFTLIPGADVTNDSQKTFTLNLLDNTKDLNGQHRYDNCDKLVSETINLGIGEWTVTYLAKDELGRTETRSTTITVQSETPFYNCFRIF